MGAGAALESQRTGDGAVAWERACDFYAAVVSLLDHLPQWEPARTQDQKAVV